MSKALLSARVAHKLREDAQQEAPLLELQRLYFYAEYKAKLEGLPIIYVNPKRGFEPVPDVWWKTSISTEWAQAVKVPKVRIPKQ